MVQKTLRRLLSHKCYFKCEMCDNSKFSKMYEYQSVSFVRGYIPKHFKKICGDCIYKKVYGTKDYKKKKKEGVLDK
jgi:hypothetical protein